MQARKMEEPAQGRACGLCVVPRPRGALGRALGPCSQHLLLSSLAGSLSCLPCAPWWPPEGSGQAWT